MAVVKSPKNVKRKQLWLKKLSLTNSVSSVNYSSNTNKVFKSKPKKWSNKKSKLSVLKSSIFIYNII